MVLAQSYRAASMARSPATLLSGVLSSTAYPKLLETAIAALRAAAANVETLSRVTRVVGPDTLTAAAIFPEASNIGAPMQRDPRYASSLSIEYPRCRIAINSLRNCAAFLRVCGVKRSKLI